MKEFCKTKIVATIGPSSWDPNILKDMITNGMDVARINASFADFEELDRVSRMIRALSPRVGLMLDTKGHKIRVTGFEKEKYLKERENIIIVSEEYFQNNQLSEKYIATTYPTLHKDITRNSKILLDDGNIVLNVIDIKGQEVLCEIEQGGILKPKKTVNIPNTHLNFPQLSEKDKNDIKYAVEHNFDFISASFIRNINDVAVIKEVMGKSSTKLIAKIEDREGIDNFDQILSVVDGIMIARGDMGVEIPLEEVPVVQKQMIYKCRSVGIPVIVATQMLESMRENINPTRAEVSDVANAVMDGCDAVMLSAETSTGNYPAKAVKMMNDIALKVENVLRPQKITGYTNATIETDELCKTVFDLVNNLYLKGVIVISQSGKTSLSLSRHRLNIPIWEISNDIQRIRQNSLVRGIKGYYLKDFPLDRDSAIVSSVECVYSYGELDLNDKIAIISGSSIKNRSNNSILEIIKVKDVIGS
ncbi:MAG: Pyruvate kinase [candidate division WS6 bacterium GW2011_GWE1_34_7]|uniref:Pyruvate kinase n=1 Tax=candidate division WS6 bacterium GW2011_GWE1_34_7 TaxID=1619093 RepID=A0A0G0B8J2_9BACT|nr:MAG: Pyruvate kinase [candidate division WS6 bacterium GW2011_GWE1_34_7]